MPTAEISHVPGRGHEPGDLTLRCVVRDTDGDLVAARVSGSSTVTHHTVAGSVDTVTAAILELAAGDYEFICTATDAGGRTSADTVTVGVRPNDPPPAALSVTHAGALLTLTQGAVVDPQGDTVQYTIVIEGPTPLTIGPRVAPIDTTFTLAEGSYRVFSIADDGFAADTIGRRFDYTQAGHTVAQSVVRDAVAFRYTAQVTSTSARLVVIRSPNDTIFSGPVPSDTTFAGATPGERAGLFKGEYRFLLHAELAGGSADDIVLDSIVDLRPTLGLSGVDAQLDQGAHSVVRLPAPADPNREDDPTYTRATSLDGKVQLSLSGADLSVTAVTDSTGPYAVELVVGDATTGVLVDTLAGVIRPRMTVTAQTVALDTLGFKSGYDDVVVVGGATSVGADLVGDDEGKNPLLKINAARRWLGWYYRLKRNLNDRIGLALGVDYSLLNQFSNFSGTDTQAASGIFRVYGTWRAFGSRATKSGNLVSRIENRHLIGPGITPRDLGFDGGSSLSTATFKEFGWGLTQMYWKQTFERERYAFVVGKMDPGDYSDIYVLLTAYKAYMNDAYVNNPSVALPQQGLGLVGRAAFAKHWYISAGLHDANGSPTEFGFDTFFEVREYYTWVEAGWTPGDDAIPGEGIHVNLWHQDPREAEGTDETWGVTFSANKVFEQSLRWSPFLRAGYSEGDGGQLVRLVVAGGLGAFVRRSDFVGFSTSWSGPIDKTLRNQVTTEAFYRLTLTENLAVTPNIQFTVNPSHTLATDALWVTSVLRLRLAL